jgi:hypothetical protein
MPTVFERTNELTVKTTKSEETPVSTRVRTSDLTKLAEAGGFITVQNNQASITLFVLETDHTNSVEWAPKGDRTGNDILELPTEYLKSQKFIQALKRGIFSIIDADDPTVLTALDAQQASWEARKNQDLTDQAIIHNQNVRAFSGIQCIAPDGRQPCSEFAIQSSNKEKPPLCSKHAHLASTYIPEETGDFKDGDPVIRWNRILTGRI